MNHNQCYHRGRGALVRGIGGKLAFCFQLPSSSAKSRHTALYARVHSASSLGAGPISALIASNRPWPLSFLVCRRISEGSRWIASRCYYSGEFGGRWCELSWGARTYGRKNDRFSAFGSWLWNPFALFCTPPASCPTLS